ncbi:MAG: alpha/beta hydrolase [Deltaproteobacteria bacterium]|nr:alpha/beta hydrolase [Deltaproteobacteria bacterium]
MQIKIIELSDGTSFEYRKFSGGSDIPIIMTGGAIGSHLIWSSMTGLLRRNHPVIVWNYPGLETGVRPAEFAKINTSDNIKLSYLADCLNALFQHENISSAVLAGWSLGPLVNREFALLHPEKVKALISINQLSKELLYFDSAHANIIKLQKFLGFETSGSGARELIGTHKRQFENLKNQLKKSDHPGKWAKRFRLVSPDIDELMLDAIIKDFVNVSMDTYLGYVKIPNETRKGIDSKLKEIPTFFAAGDRDIFVNYKKLMSKKSKLPNREYLLVKGGSHFSPLEYPQMLTIKIENFLSKFNK